MPYSLTKYDTTMKQNFKVFQIKDSAEKAHFLMFSSLSMVKHLELQVKLGNYELVYSGEVEDAGQQNNAVLEDIYMQLQGRKPEGYKGHSLSVSDIVLYKGRYYYVDDFGYEQLDFVTLLNEGDRKLRCMIATDIDCSRDEGMNMQQCIDWFKSDEAWETYSTEVKSKDELMDVVNEVAEYVFNK